MLAGCRCTNITEYHGSLLKPNSTELIIVMELMACSVADLVRGAHVCGAWLSPPCPAAPRAARQACALTGRAAYRCTQGARFRMRGLAPQACTCVHAQVQHGPLDEAFVAYVLHEVLVALAYLHSENRIHRDIKAANILLGHTGAWSVCSTACSGGAPWLWGVRAGCFQQRGGAGSFGPSPGHAAGQRSFSIRSVLPSPVHVHACFGHRGLNMCTHARARPLSPMHTRTHAPARTHRLRQDQRLWRERAAERHDGLPAPHVCGHALLDGARGKGMGG